MISDLRYLYDDIRDQGNCGSCMAFSACGKTEGDFMAIRGEKVDLSERHLFSCAGAKCDYGSTPEQILDRLKIGVALEEDCPYQDRDIRCGTLLDSEWHLRGKKIKSYSEIRNIDEMKQVLQERPLIGLMAVHQSYLHYVSGIYHSLGPSDPIVGYHAVVIVGFNDNDNNQSYWIVRNSWGSDWGMEGYCYHKFHDSELTDVMMDVEIDGPIDPEDIDDDTQCDVSRGIQRVFGAKTLERLRRLRYYITGH